MFLFTVLNNDNMKFILHSKSQFHLLLLILYGLFNASSHLNKAKIK